METATYNKIARQIISEQELVIGPLAWSEAGKVLGLSVDRQKGEVIISSDDSKDTVDRLVAQYERLFGRASHEVCKEAVSSMIASMPAREIPQSLAA